ncbi:hypothetical protein DK261_20205 [Pseudomonas sp. RW409]|nr:hypothetical protein DK261_20205 [Pseudomonas sp. RW409]
MVYDRWSAKVRLAHLFRYTARPSAGSSGHVSSSELAERRSGKAKTSEEAELTSVNEHSEFVFNAA